MTLPVDKVYWSDEGDDRYRLRPSPLPVAPQDAVLHGVPQLDGEGTVVLPQPEDVKLDVTYGPLESMAGTLSVSSDSAPPDESLIERLMATIETFRKADKQELLRRMEGELTQTQANSVRASINGMVEHNQEEDSLINSVRRAAMFSAGGIVR